MNGIKHMYTPGHELHRAVKAGFTYNGMTFASWCRANNVIPTNARQALLGSWAGPKATILINRMVTASQADKKKKKKKERT